MHTFVPSYNVTQTEHVFSEHLIRTMADHLANDGYKEAGYQYVIIDDCWLAPERDAHGRLQPDPARFPSGIPALAEYVGANVKQNIIAAFCLTSLVMTHSKIK